MELCSYKNIENRLDSHGDWKDSDGKIYSRGGHRTDNVLGIVVGRVSNFSPGSGFTLSAECSYQGRWIYARIENPTGTLSYRALSIWMGKHAIPALRKYAMEITK